MPALPEPSGVPPQVASAKMLTVLPGSAVPDTRTCWNLDGEAGLNKIAEVKPDLVILDLMLPRYGGFEVLRQLQQGETARIPIVIVTGRYTDRTTAEMIRQESNVVDFMEKPIKPAILGMVIHRILHTTPPGMKVPPSEDP